MTRLTTGVITLDEIELPQFNLADPRAEDGLAEAVGSVHSLMAGYPLNRQLSPTELDDDL